MSIHRIENVAIQKYLLVLKENSRPPSRGGNTSALHAHYLTVQGEVYSFLARGSQQWVYKSDRLTFEFELKGPYRNILPATIQTTDSKGRIVVRGNRSRKQKLRTAVARLPASRREARD